MQAHSTDQPLRYPIFRSGCLVAATDKMIDPLLLRVSAAQVAYFRMSSSVEVKGSSDVVTALDGHQQ